MIELNRAIDLKKLVFDAGDRVRENPWALEITVSEDGKQWQPVFDGKKYHKNRWDPPKTRFRSIDLGAYYRARFVKMTVSKYYTRYWSCCDLKLFGSEVPE